MPKKFHLRENLLNLLGEDFYQYYRRNRNDRYEKLTTPITVNNAVRQMFAEMYDMMEECKVVDANGNGLIRAYMADSGPNLEGDANAWIYVPYGQCAKINNGDFSGVSQAVRDKIQPSNINEAITTE